MSNEPTRKGLIELGWFGDMPDVDADLNPETRIATGGTRRQCPTCHEWCAHEWCGRCERFMPVTKMAMPR